MKTEEIKKLLHATISGLCTQKSSVDIQTAELKHSVTFSINVDMDDQAKVVGARGANINALKEIFESAEATDSKDYSLKTVRIFLNTPADRTKSRSEKFKKNPDWDSEEYRLLTEDLLGLIADAKVNAIDISGLSVFEVELLEDMHEDKKEALSTIIPAIGKCNGGNIQLNFV